jgi:hypothetical protein
MNREKLGLTLIGMAVVGLVSLNIKFNRRTEKLLGVVMMHDEMIQERVDDVFADIVYHYDN